MPLKLGSAIMSCTLPPCWPSMMIHSHTAPGRSRNSHQASKRKPRDKAASSPNRHSHTVVGACSITRSAYAHVETLFMDFGWSYQMFSMVTATPPLSRKRPHTLAEDQMLELRHLHW